MVRFIELKLDLFLFSDRPNCKSRQAGIEKEKLLILYGNFTGDTTQTFTRKCVR